MMTLWGIPVLAGAVVVLAWLLNWWDTAGDRVVENENGFREEPVPVPAPLGKVIQFEQRRRKARG